MPPTSLLTKHWLSLRQEYWEAGGSLEGWRGEAPGGGPKISYLGGV